MATYGIRKHMRVLASDGTDVGAVDEVGQHHFKLTRDGSPDGHHHRVPLEHIARVDDQVHLNLNPTEVAALGNEGAAAGGVLPPIANPALGDGVKRSNYYLPWILLALAIIVALLLIRGCSTHHDASADQTSGGNATATGALPVEAVTLPGGTKVELAQGTLNYELQRYLASDEATPRTFTFDKLNFDTGKSDIRADDKSTVDTLAQILVAYPKARAKIVGYADAQGPAPANVDLGSARAKSVVTALIGKGVDAGRLDTGSGGESNPVASNATSTGRFENRRTELVVTSK